jgi:hypothetical protein
MSTNEIATSAANANAHAGLGVEHAGILVRRER